MNEIMTTEMVIADDIKETFSLVFSTIDDEILQLPLELNKYNNISSRAYRLLDMLSNDLAATHNIIKTVIRKDKWGKRYKHHTYKKEKNKKLLNEIIKYNYTVHNQKEKTQSVQFTELLNLVSDLIISGEIPKKYAPVLELTTHITKHKIRMYRATFDTALISLLEQKYNNNEYILDIVDIFKQLQKKKGIPFDEYIDNWAARLLKEGK